MGYIIGRVIGDLARNHVLPVAIKYQNTLIENVKGLKEIFPEDTFNKIAKDQIKTIKEISIHIASIQSLIAKMIEQRKKTNKITDIKVKADSYNTDVLPYFEKIRYNADKLELLIDDKYWPLPKYREILFVK